MTIAYKSFKNLCSFARLDNTKDLQLIISLQNSWQDIIDEDFSSMIKPFKILHKKHRDGKNTISLVCYTKDPSIFRNFAFIKKDILDSVNAFIGYTFSECIIKLL